MFSTHKSIVFFITIVLVVINLNSYASAASNETTRNVFTAAICERLHNVDRSRHRDTPLVRFDMPQLRAYAYSRVRQLISEGRLGPPSEEYGENWLLNDRVSFINLACLDFNSLFYTAQRNLYNFDEYDPYKQRGGTHQFTQIIWKSTTHVACAHYVRAIFCAYYPPGNYIGEFSDNVKPASIQFPG